MLLSNYVGAGNKPGGGSALPVITGWQQIGATYDSDTYADIHPLGLNEVLVQNYSSNTFDVLELDGSTFGAKGVSFNQSSPSLNNADAGFKIRDNKFCWINHSADDFYIYDYDGSAITLDGVHNNLMDTSGYPNATYIEDDRVMIVSGNSSGDATIGSYLFNDAANTFALEGNTFGINGNFDMVAAMSPTRIAVISTASDNVAVREFDGTDWNLVGNAYSLAGISGKMGICAMAESRIVVWLSNGHIQALDWDGADFTPAGPSVSIGASSWPRSMAKLNDTTVAFHYFGSGGNVKAYEITTD